MRETEDRMLWMSIRRLLLGFLLAEVEIEDRLHHHPRMPHLLIDDLRHHLIHGQKGLLGSSRQLIVTLQMGHASTLQILVLMNVNGETMNVVSVRIRMKIGRDGGIASVIETVKGKGKERGKEFLPRRRRQETTIEMLGLSSGNRFLHLLGRQEKNGNDGYLMEPLILPLLRLLHDHMNLVLL